MSMDGLIASVAVLPGFDAGVAQHVAMRIGERDAFPADDSRLRRGLTALDPKAADEADSGAGAIEAAEAWRPWRALAATHLIAHGEARR